MIRKIALLALVGALSLAGTARGRKATVDSLYRVLRHTSADTAKLPIYHHLVTILQTDCGDSARFHSTIDEYLALALRYNSKPHILTAMEMYGTLCGDCEHDHRQAIYWYDSCYRLAVQWQNYRMMAEQLFGIANEYGSMGQNGKALAYYEQVVAMDSTTLVDKDVALGNMGVIYSNTGNYPRAADCYEHSFNLLNQQMLAQKKNKPDDTVTLMLLLDQIAEMDMKMGLYDKALGSLMIIQANYGSVYDRIAYSSNMSAIIFMDIGNCYYNKNELDKAEANYNKALAYSLQAKHYNESSILTHIGGIYLKKGDNKAAREYAMKSVQDTLASDYREGLPGAYALLGSIYTKEKNYPAAIGAVRRAIQSDSASGSIDNEANEWKQLSDIYGLVGKTKEAFAAYQHYILLRDSVFSQDKAREITSIEMQGDFDRRQEKDSLEYSRRALDARLKMQQQRLYTVSGYTGLAAALLVVFFIYRSYSKEKKALVLVSSANEKLNDEKQVSESLLLNILPEEVAKELKVNGDVQPRLFDNVTVLFTDFVNFTVAGDRMTPQELVAELHNCFKAFDQIIGKYSIEKIKTVGDAYIAVSGLPQPNDNHAADIVQAALEIRDFMAERKKQVPDNTFEIRLGINSGPVVAGIVGARKFAYDIWGDTVNVAARMEQYSEAGKVNISEMTYALVKGKFAFRDRGRLNVKNKGEMGMYFVEAPDTQNV